MAAAIIKITTMTTTATARDIPFSDIIAMTCRNEEDLTLVFIFVPDFCTIVAGLTRAQSVLRY
jgi:hypothetical protein